MLCLPLLSAVLLIELCQTSMAQREALELGRREEPVPTLATGGATLVQNVRIFNGILIVNRVPLQM
jgi:hypothetical protein